MGVTKDAMGLGLRALNRFAGLKVVDKLGLRKPATIAVFAASQAGFRTVGAASRVFRSTSKLLAPARLSKRPASGHFDLTPSDEQQMLRDTCREFSLEQLRPAALEADATCGASTELLAGAAGLGIHLLGVPEALGGAGHERSPMTGVLVTSALAEGDLGLAVACLAPTAVSQALVLWGDAEQQAVYLPAFVGETVPAATLAIQEPTALFDPFRLETKARRTPDGYVLEGVKSLVPLARTAELFVVAAQLEGRGPALFIVESSTAGLTIESEPSMGLRPAGLGRLVLSNATVPHRALLGGADAEAYADCVNLCRLGWCALAIGTAQAALDYLVPYVNERIAFGEPISHRQSVAFAIADMAIELEGMRLATWRAASRAEAGLPFVNETTLARRLCADKGMAIGSQAVGLLGGHGFVKEHPAERWYRDLRAVGFMEGVALV
ncbi:MAG TPA: acyl-CoA dehydrogenase family protein [Nevskiaceae bacterium]|nr:acyl-CoA dehydrogenase family protein [Nevskiaceae bacterium]